MSGAAIFDLDRTLLANTSGPAFSRAMRAQGLLPKRSIPGESLLFGFADRFGETLPAMALARQAVMLARGRQAGSFDKAAQDAVDELVSAVQPFAHALIAQHHAAGRPVVLATTTPEHLVRPLADRLGIDEVIATRYRVSESGTYDGGIDGPFVWGTGKLAAVARWARGANIDLRESYAYSDSAFDLPLLSAVGYPAAVNPDLGLLSIATLKRWPVLHLDVAPGVAKVPLLGIEAQQIVTAFMRPSLLPYCDLEFSGAEHVPATGPVIVAGNHRSYFDLFVGMVVLNQTGRTGRFLAKAELFKPPLLGRLFTSIGGIEVLRDGDTATAFAAAAHALAGGELLGVLPQGTIPRGEAFFDPKLVGHTGAARLAALTRAPVIPMGIWGSELVWPRSSALPNFTTVTDRPKVRVQLGPAVELKYRSPEADTRRIMAAISAQLPPEGRSRHTPTLAELRRTYPGGRVPSQIAAAYGPATSD